MPEWDDPEKAQAASRKGVKRRQELAKLAREDPDEYMRQRFASERSGLATLLLDAAYGRGTFATSWTVTRECEHGHEVEVFVEQPLLDPAKRLAAVTKAMEYAYGKPQVGRATGSENEAKKKEEPETTGFVVE
jgi:hypothetical protein